VYHKLVSVKEAVDKAWSLLSEAGWPRAESVMVPDSVGHVLAESFYAVVDSPPFDRSAMDGYALRASDVQTSDEAHPQTLRLIGRADVGHMFEKEVGPGECVKIATGAPLPRGCDAVAMVEFTKQTKDEVTIYKGVSAGENVAQAGSDVSVGDLVLRANRLITSRELAALAAQGVEKVNVYRKPTVGVFSTGDELVSSGTALGIGSIYDVNGPAVTALLREMGVGMKFYGILPDDEEQVTGKLREALQNHDVVVTSGSTSAGFGDMIYRVFDGLGAPGVIVHGIKLRPGKPTVIAVADGKLLIGLPGFPLSAMMVFHMVARPLVQRMAGFEVSYAPNKITATVPFTFDAGKGKRDLVAVQLVQSKDSIVAYPLLAHSGSASALAVADGFIDVPEEREFLQEGETVEVTTLSPALRVADLTIIGSHCLGLDQIIERLASFEIKAVNVGSWSGWQAIKRGEADIAGTHLLDEETQEYNTPFLEKMGIQGRAVIVRGYARKIGLVVAKGNPRGIKAIEDLARKNLRIVNRNKGSGIRTYLDLKLKGLVGKGFSPETISGYTYEVKTHTAVAAAVSQGRADCGLAFEAVTAFYPVDFVPLDEERYDFLIGKERLSKASVQSFIRVLGSEEFKLSLNKLPGYMALPDTGKVVAGDR
jgi:putative molybdopterin biosynthesis protein